jgi:molybdopterin converting factor small subunit
MADVVGQVLGGDRKFLKADTVEEVKELMEVSSTHTATVNGDTANDNDELSDQDWVLLTPPVKGGVN